MPTLDELQSASPSREQAWSELYSVHFDAVRRLVFRAGVSGKDVDDLTQRTFVLAYEKIEQLDELTSAGAFLRGIALRLVANHRRWRTVRRVKQWMLKEDKTPERPDEQLASDRSKERVQQVLTRMSAKHRDVLVLCDLSGLTPAEASESLNVPMNTVRSRRRAAREEFARLFRKSFAGSEGEQS